MDSTPITVCMNHKIYSHKVTKGIARRSKSTKGWWYGFKISGICNEQGDFENIIFSYANIADCKIAEKLAEVVKGQYLRMQDFYSIAAYMINRNLDFYQKFFRLRLI